MRHLIIIFVLGIFSAVKGASFPSYLSQTHHNETCIFLLQDTQPEIPENLLEYVKNKLPQYHIPEEKEFIPDRNKKSDATHLSYLVCADFNGDNRLDYGLILVSNNEKKLGIYIFNSTEKGYNHRLLEELEEDGKKIDVQISTEPAGLWEAIDTSLYVPHTGLTIELPEESLSWSYYWNGEKYVRFLYD